MSTTTPPVSGSEQSGLSRMENEGGPPAARRSTDADREDELGALGITWQPILAAWFRRTRGRSAERRQAGPSVSLFSERAGVCRAR